MTMPLSGLISLFDCNTEFGRTYNGPVALQDSDVRTLAGVSGSRNSLWDLYGKTRIIRYEYHSPGSFNIYVPPGVTRAALTLKGGDGGGGGGGKAGGGDGTDVGRGRGGSGGGGGAGGGAGQLLSTVIAVPPDSIITVNVGAGGGGGAGGSVTYYDGSWRSGQAGGSGGNGGATSIYAGGSQLAYADFGRGGAGGGGGSAGDFNTASGGASGGGYPTGQPGGWNHSAGGYCGRTIVYTSDANQANYQGDIDAYGGAGGSPGGGGGAGGAGGNRQDGWGASGGSGGNGYAILELGNSAMIGGNGPGYSGAIGSPQPPIWVWYYYTAPKGC